MYTAFSQLQHDVELMLRNARAFYHPHTAVGKVVAVVGSVYRAALRQICDETLRARMLNRRVAAHNRALARNAPAAEAGRERERERKRKRSSASAGTPLQGIGYRSCDSPSSSDGEQDYGLAKPPFTARKLQAVSAVHTGEASSPTTLPSPQTSGASTRVGSTASQLHLRGGGRVS